MVAGKYYLPVLSHTALLRSSQIVWSQDCLELCSYDYRSADVRVKPPAHYCGSRNNLDSKRKARAGRTVWYLFDVMVIYDEVQKAHRGKIFKW